MLHELANYAAKYQVPCLGLNPDGLLGHSIDWGWTID